MKKIAIISLTILSAVVLASAYFYYRWVQLNNYSPLASSPTGGEAESYSPDLGKISSGKVFTTEDRHFQFNYPQDWFLSRQSGSKDKNLLEQWQLTSYSSKEAAKKELPSGSVRIDFEVSAAKAVTSLEEAAPCDGPEILECRETKINGVSYKRVVERLASGGKKITLLTIRDAKIYKAIGYPTPGDKEEEATRAIEAVVSTFKVLD